MRFVWKQNACLGRRSGMMDRNQAVYLSCSSLSSSVFPAVMAAQLAFTIIKEYQPLLFFWLLLYLFSSPAERFYKTGGVIWGCIKMSEHICWSINVRTCDLRIINQQSLILGKQSSPPSGFICLVTMAIVHQRNWIEDYHIFLFLTWENN